MSSPAHCNRPRQRYAPAARPCVNLLGVIHGIHAFVPHMLGQGGEGHIVNTASAAALTPLQGIAPYNVSKAGVVALSETLAMDLALAGAQIGVSVLCPGFVATNLSTNSQRSRPERLDAPSAAGPLAQLMAQTRAAGLQLPATPADVADLVLAAVRAERFSVLPHPGYGTAHLDRLRGQLAGDYPAPTPPELLVAANQLSGQAATMDNLPI